MMLRTIAPTASMSDREETAFVQQLTTLLDRLTALVRRAEGFAVCNMCCELGAYRWSLVFNLDSSCRLDTKTYSEFMETLANAVTNNGWSERIDSGDLNLDVLPTSEPELRLLVELGGRFLLDMPRYDDPFESWIANVVRFIETPSVGVTVVGTTREQVFLLGSMLGITVPGRIAYDADGIVAAHFRIRDVSHKTLDDLGGKSPAEWQTIVERNLPDETEATKYPWRTCRVIRMTRLDYAGRLTETNLWPATG